MFTLCIIQINTYLVFYVIIVNRKINKILFAICVYAISLGIQVQLLTIPNEYV